MQNLFWTRVLPTPFVSQQFQQLKAGEYTDETKTWEGMGQHIYVVADALIEALAQQFPDKF